MSKEFADAIQKTDKYYVTVTREGISTLPYSVEEIYGIRNSGFLFFRELLILKSGIIEGSGISDMLEYPEIILKVRNILAGNDILQNNYNI